MAESSARIAGTVKIDGVPAARDIIVISDDPSGRQVVGEGASASDGSFDITYSDWTGPVIALALDNYGQAWSAGANLNNGTVVHPTEPNGYVYQVTSAGTTGAEEPSWSTEGSVTDGSVTYEAKPYYRPVASGPLEGEQSTPAEFTPPRFYRIKVQEVANGSVASISGIELYDVGGAMVQPASVSASSSQAGHEPESAFDGDLSSSWRNETTDSDRWVSFEFSEPTHLAKYRLASRTGVSYPSSWDVTPLAWDIEFSYDGDSWRSLEKYSRKNFFVEFPNQAYVDYQFGISLPFTCVYSAPYDGSESVNEKTIVLPDNIASGDAIVLYGMRRGDLDSLPDGWTPASVPPASPTSVDQSTFIFWRISDGSEAGSEITLGYQPGSNNRLSLNCSVFRSSWGRALQVQDLGAVRKDTGVFSSEPLSAQNETGPALVFIATSRVYGSSAWRVGVETDRANHASSWEDSDYDFRSMAFYALADSNEIVDIWMDADYSDNSSESRSDVAIAIREAP